MPATRVFAVVGLAAIFAAMGLALVGSLMASLIVLGTVVLAGLGMAVGAWLSRR